MNVEQILVARERIAPFVHQTPVMTSRTLDSLAGCSIFLKCENLQRVGAFKFRGAANAIFNLPDEQARRGVVTHSSGNHAQALALAASLRNMQAHVVMPNNAPSVKRRAVEGYGATVYLCEPTMIAREQLADQLVQQTGGVAISSYNHTDVIAGQGTVALELLEQVADLDAIVAPISGGGLIGGVAVAAQAIKPGIRIIAAEPAGADDVARSFASGERVSIDNPQTVADGLLATPGDLTWPIVRQRVERVITVTDEQIIAAMRLIWERMKLIVEPSGATSLAAVLSDEFRSLLPTGRVGVILSGGNVDLDRKYW